MKPEKAVEAMTAQKELYHQHLDEAMNAFDKKLGRLKRVEQMMRENAKDTSPDCKGDIMAVYYESSEFATMLEELQAVIAEIEGDMAFTYKPKEPSVMELIAKDEKEISE